MGSKELLTLRIFRDRYVAGKWFGASCRSWGAYAYCRIGGSVFTVHVWW